VPPAPPAALLEAEGFPVGFVVGLLVGFVVGLLVGFVVGLLVGLAVGWVGFVVGCDGCPVAVGFFVVVGPLG
jgi:hypothetical protein